MIFFLPFKVTLVCQIATSISRTVWMWLPSITWWSGLSFGIIPFDTRCRHTSRLVAQGKLNWAVGSFCLHCCDNWDAHHLRLSPMDNLEQDIKKNATYRNYIELSASGSLTWNRSYQSLFLSNYSIRRPSRRYASSSLQSPRLIHACGLPVLALRVNDG